MKISLYPFVIGGLLGTSGFFVMLLGYGVWLYYLRGLIVFCLFVFLSISFLPLRPLPLYLARLAIATMLCVLLTSAGLGILLLEKQATCRALVPVWVQLDYQRKATGSYPSTFSNIREPVGLKIRWEITPTGIDVNGINRCDAVFYLSPTNCYCIVPITKILPWSFTRFYVYRWSTDQPQWIIEKVMMIWGF